MASKKSNGENMRGGAKAAPAHTELLDILETIESNFMPYAMSVIVSRAIPEIDGLKPSHRKLLYTMYKMGLLSGARTKSANVVGQTMKLNPHGDGAIYETMVRLSRGNGSLLHPLVDSKGNFGKVFSRDMAYAASRYTEVRLDQICTEFFKDIDEDTVDFIDNYDGTLKEPSLLPTTFPSILMLANTGIAVGMASTIASFNLAEVCETTAEFMKNPNHDLLSTLQAPDFPTGADLLYDRAAMEEIYRTGRGSFRLRSKWEYNKNDSRIEITQIPYTTTIETIMDKVTELVKSGKIKEISDMRDEIDLNGLRLTIDLKRGADPEKLMNRLFHMTPLEDTFSCNFNILIAGSPHVMGVRAILEEWTAWRMECVRRRLFFHLDKLQKRLKLLNGLAKILLDIDKAISIIRATDEETEVVPNLMIGFGVDEEQAEYIAEIKLRNINKQYILKRVAETEALEKEAAETEDIMRQPTKIRDIIIKELRAVAKKYGVPRQTTILYEYEHSAVAMATDALAEDYPVSLFLTKAGYFKKITPLSLRMGGEQKFKEGDSLLLSLDTTNRQELLVFTDRAQVYKCLLHEFEDSKASILGDYLPSKLGMDEGETPICIVPTCDFSGDILFVFENGKVARVNMSCYATKTNRKKLANAYSVKSPLTAILPLSDDAEFVMYSSDGRALSVNSAALVPKTTRDAIGVAVMLPKARQTIVSAAFLSDTPIQNFARYRAKSVPAAGALLREEDTGEYVSLVDTEKSI